MTGHSSGQAARARCQEDGGGREGGRRAHASLFCFGNEIRKEARRKEEGGRVTYEDDGN